MGLRPDKGISIKVAELCGTIKAVMRHVMKHKKATRRPLLTGRQDVISCFALLSLPAPQELLPFPLPDRI